MDIKYGSILKNVLEEKNISQKELAKKIQTTEATISKYINNLQMPRLDLVDRISKILNVSTDYLLGRTDKPEIDIFDKPMTLAASMKNNADLSEISEHDKDIIRTLIEQMKKKNGE